ncbi:MAG: CAP domain-containing protein [Terriglobia bacterium]
MNEPRFKKDHRANILNANYSDVGIGIVQGPNGSLYITQGFATFPPACDLLGRRRVWRLFQELGQSDIQLFQIHRLV